MDIAGLRYAARYAYPPNSLSLCGPLTGNNLRHYTSDILPDPGLTEILQKFSTLYPYLTLIAGENRLKDPFDLRVVEAYWIGNSLLRQVPNKSLANHLLYTLSLRQKQNNSEIETLTNKIFIGGFPHHSFHVLNVYVRTGHMQVPHTLRTMDACIVNIGKVTKLLPNKVVVVTRPLRYIGDSLGFGESMHRVLGLNGSGIKNLKPGDWVSYHWGYVCDTISLRQRRNLSMYTNNALYLANSKNV